jgi:Isochorismatase family
VIEGRRALDTFASTNLDFNLRSKGISTIALGGFPTNCCVEATMRCGYENGYRVIALSDCVAATSVEEHENALKYDDPMFSQPVSGEEFVNELSRWAARFGPNRLSTNLFRLMRARARSARYRGAPPSFRRGAPPRPPRRRRQARISLSPKPWPAGPCGPCCDG